MNEENYLIFEDNDPFLIEAVKEALGKEPEEVSILKQEKPIIKCTHTIKCKVKIDGEEDIIVLNLNSTLSR